MHIGADLATTAWPSWGKTPETHAQPPTAPGAEQAPPTADTARFAPAEEQELHWLRQRDFAVRAHEQAHVAAGGQYVVRAASYVYTLGPDGRRYATGGEVHIDTAPIPGDPAATIAKARIVFRAALAPADPSPQDLRVAARARTMEATARAELLHQRREEPAAEAPAPTQEPHPTTAASARLRRRLADLFALPPAWCLSCFA